MLTLTSKFKLRLLGPFSLMDPEGRRIAIPSRKGAALIAMLAVSKDGERARGWLQTQLWGSREPKEANGSSARPLTFVRSKRPMTRPNGVFMERLTEWEHILLGRSPDASATIE